MSDDADPGELAGRRLDEALLQRSRSVALAPGELLFRAGEPGDAVYYVRSGRLVVEREGVCIARRGPGEWVGEVALLDERPRSADVRALEATELLAWSPEIFLQALGATSPLGGALFRALSGKLREDVRRRVEEAARAASLRLELEWARQIQQDMLPGADARFGPMELAAACEAAHRVGGDFYDYLVLPDRRLAIVCADVTGHGIDSALLVAMAKVGLRTQLEADPAPAAVARALEGVLEHSRRRLMLMSCCYALIDPGRGLLELANAGHPPALHYQARSGAVTAIEPHGPLLGVGEGGRLSGEPRTWAAGDVLVFYSDGLLERAGGHPGPLREKLIRVAPLGAARTRDALLAVGERGCPDGRTRRDDTTIVVVAERSPEAGPDDG